MNEIWTIGRILKWTENFFKEKGIESPRLDAEVLLGHVLEKERIYLYVHFDEPLQPQELAEYREAIKQRIRRVPVAYIIGQREFMGLTFHVTEDTLVPRPDTEILVQAAIERLKKMSGASEAPTVENAEEVAETLETAEVPETRPVYFADIGTGTGAICLSVLHYLPQATADTVDISPAARKVAEENAEALDVADRVTFYTGDLLAPLSKAQSGGAGDKASAAEETAGARYDAILSNPPYIPDADIETLAPEVRCKEPRTALAGGADGLDFYRRLVADSPALIKDDGFLAVEVGIHQAQAVAKMAVESGKFARTEIIKDYGGIERVVVVWKK